MGKGVPIGLRNLVYAKLIHDPETGKATYEPAVNVAGAISATINPNASTETLFADDGPYETATTVGQIGLELNVADIPIEVQADIFGHTLQSGVLIRKSSDVPPWVAVGFKSLKSNGKYRYTWLAKGKFALPEQNNQTKGDSVQYNTPTASASFVKRECDDEWERHIDEDHVDYVSTMGDNWFKSPYGENDTTAPVVTNVNPADASTGIAVDTTVKWTFDEPLALSTVTTDNMYLEDTSGTSPVLIAGSLSINGARTEVTFTPDANLGAAKQHTATVTTNVTDVYGNALATAKVTTFTTA